MDRVRGETPPGRRRNCQQAVARDGLQPRVNGDVSFRKGYRLIRSVTGECLWHRQFTSKRPLSAICRDLVAAARQTLTQEWWQEARVRYEMYVSVLVLEEAGQGDSPEELGGLET